MIQTSSHNYFCTYNSFASSAGTSPTQNIFGIGNAQNVTTLSSFTLYTADNVKITEVVQQLNDNTVYAYRLVAYSGDTIPEGLPSGLGQNSQMPDVIGWYYYANSLIDIENGKGILDSVITSTKGNLARTVPIPVQPIVNPQPVPQPTGTSMGYPEYFNAILPDSVTAKISSDVGCMDISFTGMNTFDYIRIGPGSCRPSGYGGDSQFLDYPLNVAGTTLTGKHVTSPCNDNEPVENFLFTAQTPSGKTVYGSLYTTCSDESTTLPIFKQIAQDLQWI